jgi:hypothetical protein
MAAIPVRDFPVDSAFAQNVIPHAPLLDEKQAAKYLNCSIAFLRRFRLLRQGPLFVKLGRLVRYRLADLEMYIVSNIENTVAA